MATTFRNIALLGATGNLGSEILRALNEAGFTVTAIQRQNSTNIAAGAAKSVKVDLSSEDQLASAFKGIDVVVSAVPNPQLDLEKVVIHAAIAAGVKRFVPSEYSSNLEAEAAQSLPIVADKLKIRRYIEEVAASNKIDWTSVNNGAFFVPHLWTSGFVGPNIKAKIATYHDGGDRVVCTSSLERIAEAVAKALSPEHAAETRNKPIYVYTAAVTERKLTQIATKITGVQFQVQDASVEDAIRIGHEGVKEGDQGKIMSFYKALMFGKEYGGDFRSIAWNEKLGLATLDDAEIEETLRGWLMEGQH
ncbi:hypothetical protein GGI35DRAFT_489402 [Trichoderma velutinum]